MHFSLCVTVLCILLCISAAVKGNEGSGGPRSPPGKPSTQAPDNEDYYSILGVARGCSERDIKSAYRRRAMSLHPDRGGDEAAFKRLVEAYETLSDATQRERYDKFGKAGMHTHAHTHSRARAGQQHPFFSSAGQDFRDIFRGFAGFHAMPPLVYNLELSLEDLFRGRKVNVALNGEQLEVEIKPGMTEGTEIRGEVVDSRGNPRTLIFILQEKPHAVYTRKNADLLLELRISLAEALLGFERTLTHLDGSSFSVRSRENEVVQTDDVLCISGLGMPLYDSQTQTETQTAQNRRRGDLFVRVKIDMPRKLNAALSANEEMRETLRKWLSESNTQSSSPVPPFAPLEEQEKRREKERKAQEKEREKEKKKRGIATFVPRKADLRDFGKNGAPPEDDFMSSSFGSFFFQ